MAGSRRGARHEQPQDGGEARTAGARALAGGQRPRTSCAARAGSCGSPTRACGSISTSTPGSPPAHGATPTQAASTRRSPTSSAPRRSIAATCSTPRIATRPGRRLRASAAVASRSRRSSSCRTSCASRADYERAASAMRGVVALDPVREAAYRDLIHYALSLGRRDEAVRLYRECAEALEQGLGVAPEPATRRLFDEACRPYCLTISPAPVPFHQDFTANVVDLLTPPRIARDRRRHPMIARSEQRDSGRSDGADDGSARCRRRPASQARRARASIRRRSRRRTRRRRR